MEIGVTVIVLVGVKVSVSVNVGEGCKVSNVESRVGGSVGDIVGDAEEWLHPNKAIIRTRQQLVHVSK